VQYLHASNGKPAGLHALDGALDIGFAEGPGAFGHDQTSSNCRKSPEASTTFESQVLVGKLHIKYWNEAVKPPLWKSRIALSADRRA
jgi:hypothetical protein